ncbi:hypothetical protein A6R68_19698 [Neotoma lepida]|uniref:Uncharacterized protein n=1 Tax=Neotoma lepida TaxID=56216 RepID=A0A1A6HI55_NEOLE|nr:hypothetical protein A6R68_19698 [Neotoma lepida]
MKLTPRDSVAAVMLYFEKLITNCIQKEEIHIVWRAAYSKTERRVLSGFCAKTAKSYKQAQCVAKRTMNVTFQNGTMDSCPINVYMLNGSPCTDGGYSYEKMMNSVDKLLAKTPEVHLRYATVKSTPKVTILVTLVSLEIHT